MTDDQTVEVTGDLTIKDITRPVVVPFTFEGVATDPFGNERAGFEGSVVINRKDYGVNWNAALETGGFLVSDKVTLEFDEPAKHWLAEEGYDPVFGARPLKRVIQRHLQDPLAEMILAGDVMDGSTVHVSAGADGLIIGDRVSSSRRERPMDAVVH